MFKISFVKLEKVLTVAGILITAVGGLVGMKAEEEQRKEDIENLKIEMQAKS